MNNIPQLNQQEVEKALTRAHEECLAAKGYRADQINPHFVYRIFEL